MTDLAQVKEWTVSDSKGEASAEIHDWLRNEGLDLWIEALTALVMNADAGFADRRARLADARDAGWAPHVQRQATAEFQSWKARQLVFKKAMVEGLQQAKLLRHQREQARVSDRSDINNLCADMADFLDDLMERHALDPLDFERADELLTRVPEWLDSPAIERARAKAGA